MKTYDSRMCSNRIPIQLLQKSNIEVLQMKNQSTTLRRARRDDRNGYIICHVRSPESEDISRRVGFGKTGITPSSGVRFTPTSTFRKRQDDTQAAHKSSAQEEPIRGRPA